MLAVVLALLASQYGYHRDEPYFRMLPPAWGYTDQPPLTPLLADAAVALFGDTVSALRIVPLLCAPSDPCRSWPSSPARSAETASPRPSAWLMAGTTLTHLLVTASLDLVVWPAVPLCAIRAVRRDQGRYWLLAGVIAGVSSFNKPRRTPSPRRRTAGRSWRWGLLAANNALEVRLLMWPMLIVLVGPLGAIFWIAAEVTILRRAEWCDLRFIVVATAVVVVFVFVGGGPCRGGRRRGRDHRDELRRGGALDRFSTSGLPVHSGHNALAGRRERGAGSAVIVCERPVAPWSELWPRCHHLN